MNGILCFLNSLAGFFIAVIILLSIVGFLGYNAVMIQHREALNGYKIENSSDIKMKDADLSYYKVKESK